MTDPYTSETAAETRQRRLEDFAGWQAERERAEMLATGTAATIRALLAEHVAEEPSVQPWRCLDAFEAARFRKRAEIAHAEWRAELDTLARAYVAALDREAAQLPLTLRGAAR
jgi:hypothetical protein